MCLTNNIYNNMPINILTQKTHWTIHSLHLDTHFPRYAVKFQLIRKSACANLYAPEIMAYSVPQRRSSCCKNVPIGLCNAPFTNLLRTYVLDSAMHLLQIQNNIPFVMQYWIVLHSNMAWKTTGSDPNAKKVRNDSWRGIYILNKLVW